MLRKQVKRLVSKTSANNYQTLNVVELDSKSMLNNFKVFQDQHKSFSIIPVLKANAYGHGLSQVAQILNGASCDFLAVDGYFEAAKIRDITDHRILVLGYIKPDNVHLLDTKRCSFVVQDIAMLKALDRLNKPVKVHVELNTGMNRLGLSADELLPYLKVLKGCKSLILEGLMTHLADADNEENDDFTKEQTLLFDKLVGDILREGFKPKYFHIAQTAGSTKVKSKYANALRVGIGLYGINPLGINDPNYQKLAGLKPVLEMKSTIVKVINLKPGDRVSYNGIFSAPHSMRIGVIPMGYYEGIPRALSSRGIVAFKNNKLPIVGRVCMNHTMIDLKDTKADLGSVVTVISNDVNQPNSIRQICQLNDLFNYSLMTGISEATRRIIV